MTIAFVTNLIYLIKNDKFLKTKLNMLTCYNSIIILKHKSNYKEFNSTTINTRQKY